MPAEATIRKRYILTFPTELKEQLVEVSERDHVEISDVVRAACREYVTKALNQGRTV